MGTESGSDVPTHDTGVGQHMAAAGVLKPVLGTIYINVLKFAY